jgi:hypothetical protein
MVGAVERYAKSVGGSNTGLQFQERGRWWKQGVELNEKLPKSHISEGDVTSKSVEHEA